MAEAVTRPTGADVRDFIAGVEPEIRRQDAETLLPLFVRVTGWEPRLWGPSIIGFGRYDYRYDSGHAGSAFVTGFSPRKAQSVLYVMPGFAGIGELLARLGPHKLGRSCLYVTRLARVDLDVLEEIVACGLDQMKQRHDVFAE